VVTACATAGSRHDATSRQTFEDVGHWVRVFDDPRRDAWQKPREVVAALGLRDGMTVADLGAGTGYFSRHLARAVGDGGVVYAVETEPRLVAHLRTRAEREGTPNVVAIEATPGDPRLPRAVDVVLVVDTYHHVDDRPVYFERLRRRLAPGGRVAIVDWHKRPLPEGPPPAHKLAREHVVEEMTKAGYRLVAEPDLLPYQYFLVFTPA
jgi:predicted methyltransferase